MNKSVSLKIPLKKQIATKPKDLKKAEWHQDLMPYDSTCNLNQVLSLIRSQDRTDFENQSIDYFIVNNRASLKKCQAKQLVIQIMGSSPQIRTKQQILYVQDYFRNHDYFKSTAIDFNQQNIELFRQIVYKKVSENEFAYECGNPNEKIYMLMKGQVYHLEPNANFDFNKIQNKQLSNQMFQSFKVKYHQALEDKPEFKKDMLESLNRINRETDFDVDSYKSQILSNNVSEKLYQLLFILDNTKNMIVEGIYNRIDSFSKADHTIGVHRVSIYAATEIEYATIPFQVYKKYIHTKTMQTQIGIFEDLKQCLAFRRLDPDIQLIMSNYSQVLNFGKNEIICQQGEPLKCLYMVLSAEVQIFQDNIQIKYLRRNDMFGEEAAAKEPAHLTCICSKPGQIISIYINDFIKEIIHLPDQIELFLNQIADQFDQKFQKKNSGSLKYINKTLYSDIKKKINTFGKPKFTNFDHQMLTPPVKDVFNIKVEKLNHNQRTPNFNINELSNYFIMKTKYFSPPNFIIFQHQSTNSYATTKQEFEKKVEQQQFHFQSQMKNKFFKDKLFKNTTQQPNSKANGFTPKNFQDQTQQNFSKILPKLNENSKLLNQTDNNQNSFLKTIF